MIASFLLKKYGEINESIAYFCKDEYKYNC